MSREYIIGSCSGQSIDVKKNEMITVIDINGTQVVDFFAESKQNPLEFLSTGIC